MLVVAQLVQQSSSNPRIGGLVPGSSRPHVVSVSKSKCHTSGHFLWLTYIISLRYFRVCAVKIVKLCFLNKAPSNGETPQLSWMDLNWRVYYWIKTRLVRQQEEVVILSGCNHILRANTLYCSHIYMYLKLTTVIPLNKGDDPCFTSILPTANKLWYNMLSVQVKGSEVTEVPLTVTLTVSVTESEESHIQPEGPLETRAESLPCTHPPQK